MRYFKVNGITKNTLLKAYVLPKLEKDLNLILGYALESEEEFFLFYQQEIA